MKKSTNLLILILVISMMAVLFVGCQKSEPTQQTGKQPGDQEIPIYELPKDGDSTETPLEIKASKSYKIGVAIPHLANPHFVAQAYGYYAEAEKLGVEVILFEAGGYANLNTQLEQVEDLVNMPVDALILVAINGEGTIPMVDAANEAGIPVVNVNVMTDSKDVVTRVRSEDVEIGRMQAEYMAEKIDGKGDVIILGGPAGTSFIMDRVKGFTDYMVDNFPDVNIVDTKYFDHDPSIGMKEMEDALQTYPDLVGVMVGSGASGVGAAQALYAAGKSDDVVFTTADTSADVIQGVVDGRINATVGQQSVTQGEWGVRAAVAILEGKADQLVKRYWTPLFIIDESNVETFEYEGISETPAGWKLP